MDHSEFIDYQEVDNVQFKNRTKTRISFIEEKLSHSFSNLGSTIARYPLYFIFLPVLLTAILSTGLFTIKINRDFDYLFTATDGKAESSRRLVDKLFPTNTSEFFDMPRASKPKEFVMIVIIAKDEGSMLRDNVFNDVHYVHEIVNDLTVWSNGKAINYSQICGKRDGKCVENKVFRLSPHIKDIRNGKHKVHYPIHINNFTMVYEEYIQSIGGVEVDKNGHIKDIKAVRLIYPLDISNKSKIPLIEEWQIRLWKSLTKVDFNRTHISFVSDEIFKEEIRLYTSDMLKRAKFIVFALIIFSLVSCMEVELVRSKPLLGPSSCISAGLALVSAIGLLSHLGIEYMDFCILLYYGVLCTEIDDAFVFIASWQKTDCNDKIERRMRVVYSKTAVSVTITSFTTVLSFAVGSFSTVPAIRFTCIYGSLCCFFAYVYQLTFFGGCMALSGYREEKKLNPFTFRLIEDAGNSSERVYTLKLVRSQLKEMFEMVVLHKAFKVLTVIIFFVLLALGIKGVCGIKYGNDPSDAFSYDSTSYEIMTKTYRYFGKYTSPVHVIFPEYMNYADPSIQLLIERIANNFTSYKHIAEPDLEMSWIKHLKLFSTLPIGQAILTPFNMSIEESFSDALKNVFLRFPQCRPYADDIRFNEDNTKVLSSRIIFLTKDIYGPEMEMDTVKHLYNIARKSPIPIEIFSLAFHVLESSLTVPRMTIQLGVICFSFISLTFLLFSSNFMYALGISVVVLCSIVEIIGLGSFWGVKLDYVNIMTFSFCMGLCMNYPSHMSFAILTGGHKSSEERRKDALDKLAFPISQGCFSTLLGIVSVGLHQNYISQSACKIFVIISLVSAFHGLFTIPTFLEILEVSGKRCKLISHKNEKIYHMTKQLTFEKSLLEYNDSSGNKF